MGISAWCYIWVVYWEVRSYVCYKTPRKSDFDFNLWPDEATLLKMKFSFVLVAYDIPREFPLQIKTASSLGTSIKPLVMNNKVK